MARSLATISRALVSCERCPRLRAHCARVARVRVRRHRDEEYWGRPVPGWGDPRARLLVLGLAPAAHGANRTGRMFTGDSSGDWLHRALHRAGFASEQWSQSRDDGLVLRDAWVTAAAHCAPPGNRPSPEELSRCRTWLADEVRALERLRVILALGAIAWDAALRVQSDLDLPMPSPRPSFGHGREIRLPSGAWLVGSYHPSRQNTQTGRLDEEMLDRVVGRARVLCGARAVRSGA